MQKLKITLVVRNKDTTLVSRDLELEIIGGLLLVKVARGAHVVTSTTEMRGSLG